MGRTIGFLATFLAAWFALDRLAVSPPMPIPALIAFGVAAAIVTIGQVVVYRTPAAEVARAIGLGRPVAKAVGVAVLVGGLVIAGYLLGARALGVELQLRAEWPLVFIGALLFHGLAEELVWRGFVFGRLRDTRTFRRAVVLSIPLIALTHVPIFIANGPIVGSVALLTAAITCLPLAYLYERGGRTIWAPAIVHGMVGAWQLFERTYPMSFSMVVMVVTIGVPLLAFAFRDRFFGGAIEPTPSQRLAAQPA
jgi:membrane protease YdiL (CAAX protease family)